ncbi:hypothetical protein AB0I51_16285 [Streptomyces sp. NPDC050549]|uniref:hypothetical protein n=1 Tax=Streptomyces sp. NPDC050549 TaxID=3155406 RepID=UPI003427295D
MTEPYVIELEPEVRAWLETLPPQHYRQVEEKAELLGGSPTTLSEPHSRNLGEGVKRAKLAKELCEAEHGPAHDEFTREFREEL